MVWPKGKQNPRTGLCGISDQMRRVLALLTRHNELTARELVGYVENMRPEDAPRELNALMTDCCNNLLRRELVERTIVLDEKRRHVLYRWKLNPNRKQEIINECGN